MKKIIKFNSFICVLTICIFSFNTSISQTNTSPTQTVCAGSLSEPYLINPPNSGSTYQWSISGGGVINTGITSNQITVDWGVNPGVYTISVIETDINGCVGLPVTVEVTVNPLPTATLATNQTACFGSSVPPLTAIGANVSWYSDALLSTIVGSGNSFNTGQTSVGIYTYYVTETLNGCEGPSTPVTLEIYNVPSSPIVANQTVCFGSSIPALTAVGNNISWYSDSTLTNLVSTGTNFNTGMTAVGVYTYYVTDTDMNGCESAPSTILLEIYNVPSSPIIANQTVCFGSSIPALTAVGNNISWYTDPTLTNLVSTGTNFSTGMTAVGVYTYYVTDTDINGCESTPSTISLEIFNLPSAPLISNQTACEGSVIPNLSAIGNNVSWYSDSLLTNLIYTGNSFNTGQTTVGTYTYYVTETNSNGCESPVSLVTLTINSFNSMPITNPVSACFGANIPNLTVSGVGTSFEWYSDAALTTIVGNNSPFVHGQTNIGIYTYYVIEVSSNGCVSPAASVTLEIFSVPNTGPINHW
ncbi:MAG: hypothetical protein CMP51_06375 [Flavobacteriales bacterium]|nr:hypothetical protein [Flavobacteriales bacterium]|tara:strand:- start:66 stop:1649 length:1584 start_codon:yes stop_codon:yes gene_type:complete